jgi:hypothetical protein
VVGQVRLSQVDIPARLSLWAATLVNGEDDALVLAAAHIGILLMEEQKEATGLINFRSATIDNLVVDYQLANRTRPILPPLSTAHGWVIGAVHGFLRTDRYGARAWLDTVPNRYRRRIENPGQSLSDEDTQSLVETRKAFESQPWREFAKVYEHTGRPEDARWLRWQASRKITKFSPWFSKPFRWVYGGLVGYGYYPLLTIIWIMGLFLLVGLASLANQDSFVPVKALSSPSGSSTATLSTQVPDQRATMQSKPVATLPSDYPRFDPWLVAVDSAIPAAQTGQADFWRPTDSPALTYLLVIVKVSAWILAALLLAGATGFLRKDN